MARKRMPPRELVPGTNLARLDAWIKDNAIKGKLLFMSWDAEYLAGELRIKDKKKEGAWNMLRSLERKGLLTRTRLPKERGILLTLKSKTKYDANTVPAKSFSTAHNHVRRNIRKKKENDAPESIIVVNKLLAELEQIEMILRQIIKTYQ
jgi:hypothetical protein